jgi:hypothetical protein
MVSVGVGGMLRFLDALDHRDFLGAPPLREGETVTWSGPMGYVRPGLTRGGVLYATDHRVMFVPNLVERRWGVKRWESPRDEVEDIGRVSERNLLALG